LPKADHETAARACLELMSGRAHRVYTAVALAGPAEQLRLRLVETRVKVKHLEPGEIDAYVASGEWRGKAGGYAIQGSFAAHVISIIGSYTNIVGLPLYETAALLRGAGWRP
jgi:septum formation protein